MADELSKTSLDAARRVFDAHLPIAKRIASSFAARFPSLGLREDIESAALTALWRASLNHAAKPRGNIEGYVVLVVKGACLDELAANDWLSRRARRKHGSKLFLIPLDALEHTDRFRELSVAAEAEFALDRKELLDRLRPAIAKLRKRERIILSKFLSGMSWVEIAREMRVTQPRVSQIWSRIVGKIQGELGLAPVRAVAKRDWRAMKRED